MKTFLKKMAIGLLSYFGCLAAFYCLPYIIALGVSELIPGLGSTVLVLFVLGFAYFLGNEHVESK